MVSHTQTAASEPPVTIALAVEAALRSAWPELLAIEAFVLSEYTQLGEARAGLLADIAKNGRVYGR